MLPTLSLVSTLLAACFLVLLLPTLRADSSLARAEELRHIPMDSLLGRLHKYALAHSSPVEGVKTAERSLASSTSEVVLSTVQTVLMIYTCFDQKSIDLYYSTTFGYLIGRCFKVYDGMSVLLTIDSETAYYYTVTYTEYSSESCSTDSSSMSVQTELSKTSCEFNAVIEEYLCATTVKPTSVIPTKTVNFVDRADEVPAYFAFVNDCDQSHQNLSIIARPLNKCVNGTSACPGCPYQSLRYSASYDLAKNSTSVMTQYYTDDNCTIPYGTGSEIHFANISTDCSYNSAATYPYYESGYFSNKLSSYVMVPYSYLNITASPTVSPASAPTAVATYLGKTTGAVFSLVTVGAHICLAVWGVVSATTSHSDKNGAL